MCVVGGGVGVVGVVGVMVKGVVHRFRKRGCLVRRFKMCMQGVEVERQQERQHERQHEQLPVLHDQQRDREEQGEPEQRTDSKKMKK